ncbi:MAG TPA: hypothetical protein VKU01_03135 [Bryobacteraceae bacterium]|nr:hypothetical protein [Bryobacteraceae bacterium]
MKLGFFSPLPPAPTGVADYSAALLPALKRMGAPPADINLYHLGNNQLHRDIYERALREPGVVVLHDALLQHFFLGSLTEQEYVEEFKYNYGAWSESHARSLWRARARSGSDAAYFRYPMLKRIAEVSRAIIVHNPGAAEVVRAHAPNAVIYEIPHLFIPPDAPPAYEVERLRARLRLSGSTFLLAVFGHLRESKRITTVLRAFERVRQDCDIQLLLAGDFASRDLERSLTIGSGILRVPYLPDADFWLYASAVDACINLRYPSAGETSGIAIRLMGMGKAIVLTEGLEISRFPRGSCIPIPPGLAEEEMLADCMYWLATHPYDAQEIGRRAEQHIGTEHSIDQVAKLYWRTLETACYHDRKPVGLTDRS